MVREFRWETLPVVLLYGTRGENVGEGDLSVVVTIAAAKDI